MSDGPEVRTRPEGLMGRLRVLLELVKFEHSVFALPYAYIGAIYGAATVAFAVPAIYPTPPPVPTPWVSLGHWPTWGALVWVTVAMVGARAFAFVVNRAVDKEIDARNPRTAARAVPAGFITAWELWAFAALMLAGYLVAVFQLAPLTHLLWPVPLAAFVVYPYLKRFTPLAHFWLGACLGLGAVGGWAAVGASLADPTPWVFGAAVAGLATAGAARAVRERARRAGGPVGRGDRRRSGCARAHGLCRWRGGDRLALRRPGAGDRGRGVIWRGRAPRDRRLALIPAQRKATATQRSARAAIRPTLRPSRNRAASGANEMAMSP